MKVVYLVVLRAMQRMLVCKYSWTTYESNIKFERDTLASPGCGSTWR